MPFATIQPPVKPAPHFLVRQSQTGNIILRDQFTHSTWILLGACFYALASGVLSFLLPKSGFYLSAIIFTILACYVATAILQTYGILANPEMNNVIPGLTSAVVPDVDGIMPSVPAQEGIVVMFLGFKVNHPLKLLAPGAKIIGDQFQDMITALDTEEGRHKYGILGISAYLGTSDHTSNEVLHIMYWRNVEGVHAFAESDVHRVAWDYWNRTVKEHPYLSISHEIYHSNGGQHENIYGNAKPTLIGGTAFPINNGSEKHEQEWLRPLVDVNRGPLRTSKGRLGLRKTAHDDSGYGYPDA